MDRQENRRAAVVVVVASSLCVACAEEPIIDLSVPGGDEERGRVAVLDLECGVCHVIPDVPGARGQVGPPLASFARHVYIAGKFPNTPDVLLRFLPDAPAMAPETGMPAIAMSEQQTRDIAAYLYTLK